MNEVYCKCGKIILIEGEYPKFYAYCDRCHKYVDSFDTFDYAADCYNQMIDSVHQWEDGDL